MDLTDSYTRAIPAGLRERYAWCEVRNAAAVIESTNPRELREIVQVLDEFALVPDDVLERGGNKSRVARRLDERFRALGWREGHYETRVTSTLTLRPHRPAGEAAPLVRESEMRGGASYLTDNLKGGVALDVEWNAKDGNLDRDLAAFRSLYEGAIIDVGVIVTRSQADLRALGARLGREDFLDTTTTTNLDKLAPRLARGDAGGCPVLAVAITARCFRPDPSVGC